MTVSRLTRALTLGLLAITLPLAARSLYGPRGAVVHIRWEPSVNTADRQRLETNWQLVDGQVISPFAWRYDLTAPSEDRLRAIVEHASVADTHFIDRQRHTLAPVTARTARRHGQITVGAAHAVGLVDRLAMLLAMLAAMCALVRHPIRKLRRCVTGVRPASDEGAAEAVELFGRSLGRAASTTAIALVLAPGMCLIAFASVVTRMLPVSDFRIHIYIARELAETREILPHFGYHATVIIMQAFTPADWMAAAGIVTLGGVAACAVVVAWWLREALDTSARALLVASALVPAALFVVQPILPLDPTQSDEWLMGYFPPNQWHSPTTLFSKPFALLLLGLGPAVVWAAHGTRAGRTRMLTSAALVVASVLVKPNFMMAFLPALSVLAVLHWRHTDWRWLGLGFATPAVAVLAWQYSVAFIGNTDGASVILAPLHDIGLQSSTDPVTLGWRLVASVLFPLTAIACFSSVRADRRVLIGWATFVIGVAIGYLLAEGGHLAGSGNFFWSGQLAAFVLFVASAVAVLRDAATGCAGVSRLGRFAVCGIVFLWHVTSGIQHLYSTWLA